MQMTEEEICKRFKRNGCYKGHIAILAQLNSVEPVVIEKILKKGGLYKSPSRGKGNGKSDAKINTSVDLNKYVGRGSKMMEVDAGEYVKELRSDDRI